MMIVPGSAFLPRVASGQAWDGFPDCITNAPEDVWEGKDGTTWNSGGQYFESTSNTITLESKLPVTNWTITSQIGFVVLQMAVGSAGSGDIYIYHDGDLLYTEYFEWYGAGTEYTHVSPPDLIEILTPGIVKIVFDATDPVDVLTVCWGNIGT